MQKKIIEHLRIAVSSACNLRCGHCYVPIESRVNATKYLESLIPMQDIIKLLKKLKEEYSLKKISISGGEPLFDVNWDRTKDLLAFARDNNLRVQLNTNGNGNVDIKKVMELMQGKQDLIDFHVSLDSDDEKFVDSFRGKEGTFQNAIKQIKSMVSNELSVKVRYTVCKSNKDRVLSTYKLISDIGVKFFLIKPVFSSGTALNKQELFLNKQEYKNIQINLANSSIGNNTKCEFPQPVFFTLDECEKNVNVKILTCNCGSSALYLSDDGNLYPCTYLVGAAGHSDYKMGNIKTDMNKIEKIWNSENELLEFRDSQKKCPTFDILNRVMICSEQ